ncbi:MAG TPA: hypothetical protein VIK91_23605 [Nannocystis sp.]
MVREPWQYTPALEAAIPPGVFAVPVFELADGRTGRAQIGVAVAGAGSGPRLEVWDFDQNNPRERLERVGEARELIALQPGGERRELDAVRTAIARPGNEFVRMRGLDGTPEVILPELVELATIVGDEAAEPGRRAGALAALTRALDDHLLFTENRLPALLTAFSKAGTPEVAQREALGERRVALTLRDPPHRLVFARTGERWVLSEVTLVRAHSSRSIEPAAEPSPTAP